MAKVAAAGPLSSDSLHLCGGNMKAGPVFKRKTPSELRGEQLKRRNSNELSDECLVPLHNSNLGGIGHSQSDLPKNTRLVDMRLDEVYPARKPGSMLKSLAGKAKAKENVSSEEKIQMKTCYFPSKRVDTSQQELNCLGKPAASDLNMKDNEVERCSQTKNCSLNRFLSVAELSLGSDRLLDKGTVDMDKALKGVAAHETSLSGPATDSARKTGDMKSTFSGNTCSELHVSGARVPLDFTLKTAMRIVSSSPLHWLNRLFLSGTYNGMSMLSSQSGAFENPNKSFKSTVFPATAAYSFDLAHSWVYPQASLPTSIISILCSSTGEVEMDFLNKRHSAWEDSYRNLYYMLRRNMCNIFYVCTSQFVAMFIATGGVGKTKRNCNAYISQSTRGLRSLLQEHDAVFSMPLCSSKVEHISREDLVELSEIEKCNLGQTKRLSSMSDVDNTPQSLLAFSGNENVHGLFDFLLNYRSLLTSLTNVDIPMLYAPVPFLNAALSSPEVRCKEFKRAAHATSVKNSSIEEAAPVVGSSVLCYSIEVKDAYLPPWIISSIIAAMCAEGRVFEASFNTESTSTGLNIALEAVDRKTNIQGSEGEESEQHNCALGIQGAVVVPDLRSFTVKGLKYCNDSYTVSLSPALF